MPLHLYGAVMYGYVNGWFYQRIVTFITFESEKKNINFMCAHEEIVQKIVKRKWNKFKIVYQ